MYNIPKSSPGMIQHGYSPTAIETFPAGADIPFGAAVSLEANGTVVEASNGNLIGFAVASHVCVGNGKYLKDQPVGVLTQGTITVKASGKVDANARLNYHGTQKAVMAEATGGNKPAFLTLVAKQATANGGLIDVQVLTTK
jgi:hypothetical protein